MKCLIWFQCCFHIFKKVKILFVWSDFNVVSTFLKCLNSLRKNTFASSSSWAQRIQALNRTLSKHSKLHFALSVISSTKKWFCWETKFWIYGESMQQRRFCTSWNFFQNCVWSLYVSMSTLNFIILHLQIATADQSNAT